MLRLHRAKFISVLCILLCLVTAIIWITSYFVPIGFMTAHRWFNGSDHAGSKVHAFAVIDGVLYDYQIHLEPARYTPELIDRPYHWFGHDVVGLHYHRTYFGLSLDFGNPNGDAETVASQFSFPFLLVPLTLAIPPLARRKLLRNYVKVTCAIFSILLAFNVAISGDPDKRMLAQAAMAAWIIALLVPGVRLLIRAAQKAPPGHCPTCHYNLTANTSGICPECGTAITTSREST
ncbi:MAG TPA: hypothetical protein VIM11_02480, partial [Tepidisphaeraceae bacterium]